MKCLGVTLARHDEMTDDVKGKDDHSDQWSHQGCCVQFQDSTKS